jgi:DNA primase
MAFIDRDEVLERTDLAELATEICGPPRGAGAGRRWHCPNPNHPDEHPSMGLYRRARGHQRWKCHACGEGGTAVDMLMISTGMGPGPALRELARAAGFHVDPIGAPQPARPKRPSPQTRQSASSPDREPDPAVEEFVARAAALLWQPIAQGARQHLHARGLTDPVLHSNRVGFDPGPDHLPRPDGLPRRGPGIVYPALRPRTGTAVYYQVRYLDPARAGRKYDQPIAGVAPNPQLATVRVPPTAPQAPPRRLVIVCEGFPDALSVAHTGLTSVAVLGVSHAAPFRAQALAARLASDHPGAAFAVCFDADEQAGNPSKLPAGRIAAGRLAAQLASRGITVARLLPPPGCKDLNDWWRADPDALADQLTATCYLLAGDAPSHARVPVVSDAAKPRRGPVPELSPP